MRLLSSLIEKAFTQTEHSLAVHHFHIHLACILFTPQFLLGITLVPREIKDNGYAKFWEVNKVRDLSENGE